MIATLVVLLRLTATAMAGVGAVAALAATAGWLNDSLDALTHFAPYWLALGLAGLLLWFATGGRDVKTATPIAGAVAVLLAGGLILPELVRSAGPQPTAGRETLKLVQFNLWGRNTDPEGSVAWIRAQKADVVVLEEAFGEAGGVARALADDFPYQTSCAEPDPCPVMILSRREPVSREGLGAASAGDPLPAVRVTWRTAAGEFSVIGAHYIWPYPAGPQQEMTRDLAKAIHSLPADSTIVAGDFNSTPWSFSLRRQDRLFGLARRTRALATWPAASFSRYQVGFPVPFLPIDHVYAGSAWKTVSVERGPKLGSDHYPVVVVLSR
ncbi:hypothetical protein AMEJIAPC_01515 [Caulobacter sp. NIBR1757]|nr:hypothetical protein AMEJIAPC_01515 [Caulobacter sp. NIBR1757]